MQKILFATILALAVVSLAGTAFAEEYILYLTVGQGDKMRLAEAHLVEEQGKWSGEIVFHNKVDKVLQIDAVAIKELDNRIYIEASNSYSKKSLVLDTDEVFPELIVGGTVTTTSVNPNYLKVLKVPVVAGQLELVEQP